MKYEAAENHAKTISREYGRTVIFREPGADESYQAMVSSLPPGATVIAVFDDGKQVAH